MILNERQKVFTACRLSRQGVLVITKGIGKHKCFRADGATSEVLRLGGGQRKSVNQDNLFSSQ